MRRSEGVSFGDYVEKASQAGRLVVQPRMGFCDPDLMRLGLIGTKDADATTVGTLTLDSYTRTGNHDAAERALEEGIRLNGYPIVVHPWSRSLEMLRDVHGPAFPVQVRHGSSRPQDIFRALVGLGLGATEGGPVSYCLPYSRTPISEAVDNWVESTELLAEAAGEDFHPHLESFGGCMLGQLCPPGLLVALSLLEGIFFVQHGIRSVSLSYAQQTDPAQDEEAVHALRTLASLYLPNAQWHVVFYTYMGVFPRTSAGAAMLSEQAARTAMRAGAARVIVKTEAEAHRIPTIEENVRALEAGASVGAATARAEERPHPTGVLAQASALVEAVLTISEDVGRALPRAFAEGVLDLPFCLHPDNRGSTRSYLDRNGRLQWLTTGNMPISPAPSTAAPKRLTADDLLFMLRHVERLYDTKARNRAAGMTLHAANL